MEYDRISDTPMHKYCAMIKNYSNILEYTY